MRDEDEKRGTNQEGGETTRNMGSQATYHLQAEEPGNQTSDKPDPQAQAEP